MSIILFTLTCMINVDDGGNGILAYVRMYALFLGFVYDVAILWKLFA